MGIGVGLLEGGDGGEQALGVGMGGVGGDEFGRTFFDEFTVFENRDLIADVFNDGEVVGNKEVGEVKFFLEVHQKVNDLGLDRDIEGTDRLVANNKLRFDGEGASNADALALASAKFVGEAAGVGRIEADKFQEFCHSGCPIGRRHLGKMNFKRFGENGADA